MSRRRPLLPRAVRVLTTLLWLVSPLTLSCSSQSSTQIGGETNWLRACQADSDCGQTSGDGASCLCGVCTRACDQRACGAGQICAELASESHSRVCGQAEKPAICLPACNDGQCRDGYRCTAGSCVPARGATGSTLLAFPGAEGFGARVQGGRGGRVLKVTTLAADGPGSLRAALGAEGPRLVVFEVSGVIEAPEFEIAHGDLTLAGQSAPGAGITLQGRLRAAYDASVGNIVIRHIRVRPRYDGSDISQFDAIQLSLNHDLILDHVSAAFAVDETLDILEAENVTIQWSSIEALDDADNPSGRFIRGLVAGPNSSRISVHHSFCSHNRGSCVSLARGPAELVSSFFFDARAAFTHSAAASGPFNLVGNSFRSGPNLTLLPFVFDDENAIAAGDLGYYLHDNWLEDATADCPSGNLDDPWSCDYEIGRTAEFRSLSAFDFSMTSQVAITTNAGQDTEALVLAGAGAFPRDRVTRSAVENARTDAGSLDPPYPDDLLEGLKPQSAPTDGDGDGMPDEWETRHGLDPRDADDQNAILGSGYPAIEEYLNELAAELMP